MTMAAFLEVFNKFGPLGAVLILFVWFDWKRRKRDDAEKDQLVERLTRLEEHQRGRLEELIQENTLALQDHSRASREMAAESRQRGNAFRSLTLAMRTRPCLHEALNEIDREKEKAESA